MANTYGIVRLDRVRGTADGRLKAYEAMQNGMFVVQDEVNGVVKLSAAILDKIKLVASICNQYDSMNEGDFTNKVDSYVRTYEPVAGDIITTTCFGLTDEASTVHARTAYANIIVGDRCYISLVAADKGKLTVLPVADAKATAVVEYEVIGKTKLNGDNAIQIKCLKA